MFQEFVQVGTAEAVKKEGTGLGLPLAKRFVELQAGQMWLEPASAGCTPAPAGP
ncbi:MAG TPA: hypothetical protein VMV93_07625 [Chloroflexota bacterium]|nr:hypothetical protein [Chloroflexota bacterium]